MNDNGEGLPSLGTRVRLSRDVDRGGHTGRKGECGTVVVTGPELIAVALDDPTPHAIGGWREVIYWDDLDEFMADIWPVE